MSDDPVQSLRDEITANDLAIVGAVNRRLELVARLREVKRERGLDFLDRDRESWLLDHLVRENPGPLSEEGVRAFSEELLALTKRELAERDGR